MYILLYSLILFQIKFVRNTDLPQSLGPVMIHLTVCFGYKNIFILIQYDEYNFFLFKGLIKVYTMRDIKHRRDKPHGMLVIIGIIITILFSLFVQLL